MDHYVAPEYYCLGAGKVCGYVLCMPTYLGWCVVRGCAQKEHARCAVPAHSVLSCRAECRRSSVVYTSGAVFVTVLCRLSVRSGPIECPARISGEKLTFNRNTVDTV